MASSPSKPWFRSHLAILFALLFSMHALAADSDGDGVDDAIDAFPGDGCAITDTDGDGKPNDLEPKGNCLIDGFETGNFSANAWTSSPAWSVLTGGRTGTRAAKQPTQAASTLTLNYTFAEPRTLVFYYKNSGLSSGVNVRLDGVIIDSSYPSSTSWAKRTEQITSAGTHTVQWNSASLCSYTCSYSDLWLDDIGSTSLQQDSDDDNDGVADASDKFPLDPAESLDNDNDGTGNNADIDDDNDTVLDAADNCPFNANLDQLNSDGDAQGNACDGDDDNDGASDGADKFPLNPAATTDSDNDGFPNNWNGGCDAACQAGSGLTLDNCPTTSNATQANFDGDAQGDACDTDDDNDGVLDTSDKFPFNSMEWADTDNDSVGNNTDTDDDNDGVADGSDNCPLNANPDQADIDSDGQGNACDGDSDNDGVVDTSDKFPLNPAASIDSDNDGSPNSWNATCDAVCQSGSGLSLDNCPTTSNPTQANFDGDTLGDACDSDDDNDGVADTSDKFPFDPTETFDNDNDGIGNNADADDDNDSVLDADDNCPLNSNTTQLNTDGDAQGNTCDVDDDNDGVTDNFDKFPLDVAASADSDNDGFPADWNAACDVTCQTNSALTLDNCPSTSNANQLDTDGDAQGDACDSDDDNDGLVDTVDAYPLDSSQAGDADADGVDGFVDNCPGNFNADQLNTDGDAQGNVCDDDDDNDGVVDVSDPFPLSVAASSDGDYDGYPDNWNAGCDVLCQNNSGLTLDNCPMTLNADQADLDDDGQGDICDADDDDDSVADLTDNCPLDDNNDQGDSDVDGTGDRCDPAPHSAALAGGKAIAAGNAHVCVLTIAGGVKCWGDNAYGQLGDGTTARRLSPVNVTGLAMGVVAISAGNRHTCALLASGVMKCWGYNGIGQLGDGTTTGRLTPVTVNGITNGVIAMATGYDYTCALTANSGVKCWGAGSNGALGNGSTAYRTTPTDVTGLTSGVKAIVAATGFGHTCALMLSGAVKCWGYNRYGELGDGTLINRTTPVNVSGMTSGVIALSTGFDNTCALTSAGGLKCWGYNWYGQLGDGTMTQRTTPVDVVDLSSGMSAVESGERHTCALTSSGDMKCWGDNAFGQLGDGTTTARLLPVDAMTSTATAMVAGGGYTCVIASMGRVLCWGLNSTGQLGDGTTVNHAAPEEVIGFVGDSDNDGVPESSDNCPNTPNTDQINTDGDSDGDNCDSDDDNDAVIDINDAFPLDASESVDTDSDDIGNNADTDDDNDYLDDITEAALGNHPLNAFDPPRAAPGANYVLGVDDHNFGTASFDAAVVTGTAWDSTGNFIKTGTMERLHEVVASANTDFCGIGALGIWCWWWAMDDGVVLNDSLQPLQINGTTYTPFHDQSGYLLYESSPGVWRSAITDATHISGDNNTHACVISKTKGIYCWAANSLIDTVASTVPASLKNIGTVTDVAVGANHACVINNGAVQCWGDNTLSQGAVPAEVSAPQKITAGSHHSCAINGDGRVSCWGDNSMKQRGDNNKDGYVDGVSNALSIAAGDNHTCVVTGSYVTGGTSVQCWGDNAVKQSTVPRALTNGSTTPININAAGNQSCAVLATNNTASATTLACWPTVLK